MAKTDKKKAATRTLVTLLLDRSGSMQRLKEDTIGAINAYRETLRASGEDIRYSQVHFDCEYSGEIALEKVLVAEKIAKVGDMTPDDYRPRGGTPLIDAACATIRAVAELLRDAGKTEGTKVVIAIQTDGAENQSRENGWADLKALVAEKEKEGWEFVFMGAGIDAYSQGARMGISRAKTISYGTDRDETRAAFSATAMNTAGFASGALADIGYTDAQKWASGDRRG